MEHNRREFLKKVAQAGALGALTWIGIGCSDDDGEDDGSGSDCPYTLDNNGNIVLNLEECEHLQHDSAAIFLSNSPVGGVIVTHTTGDDYHAFNPRCTHEGCTVAASTPTLNCPCHGSRYHLTGSVANGPATAPLAAYPVNQTGNLLTIVIT